MLHIVFSKSQGTVEIKLFTVSSILVEILIDLESINPFHRPEIEMYIGRAV